MNELDRHFHFFRKNIIGHNQLFPTHYGKKRICYADWAASGRLYGPIGEKILYQFGPFVANTHTETNVTGKSMTWAYQQAKGIIKKHVHASENDVLFFEGTGMTGALHKLQRIVGLALHEKYKNMKEIRELSKPVVFLTHMEHHSNQISWEETIADVLVIPPDSNGDVSPVMLEKVIKQYKDRPLKIGSFTACSNVTGVQTPYHQLAEVMHRHGGICFVDFSASAPYITMNMHPENPLERLDGIFFSPHKFLGGPGSMGVAVISKELYGNQIPDRPGGGTVHWTNPWGGKSYIADIEDREDGGTPGFLQAIRTALAIRLKEEMGSEYMMAQDKRLLHLLFERLTANKKIILLEENKQERLPIISFYVEGIHHQLIVKLLNDVHGIQVRGGCSCAGTYGHYLLNIGKGHSRLITDEIDKGNFSIKPGWVRVSLHPTMTEKDVVNISEAICDVVNHIEQYKVDYRYIPETNDFQHKNELPVDYDGWFTLPAERVMRHVSGLN
ncbi:aminotransferase class V-fold PLP-dependent enzyme [Neobacillus vireti]|uniref:Aminotransferase n=1 Tax=Neobacillus vireti LMG 21834 TaxID=1131730 RepID=A0AB94ISL9_9BACI|nr:aminotransferase class V-fold PLP-dependent enzyme [Neobacillus vireti]ETI69977.1 aminotransferase [Neobacillus vireti LMG 21834]KLT15145.1 selenocysteine lyase [Neobacillus vireti]